MYKILTYAICKDKSARHYLVSLYLHSMNGLPLHFLAGKLCLFFFLPFKIFFFPSFLTAGYVWPLWKKDAVCLLAWFTVHGDLHSFSRILCFSPLHLSIFNSKISWACSNDICMSIKWKLKYFLIRGKRNAIPKLHPASSSYTSLRNTKYNIWSGHLPWVQYER